MHFTDEQWAAIVPLLPPLPRRPDGRGRPWQPDRPVLEAVLWRIQTGSRWGDLPAHYPPRTTCFRRYQLWHQAGFFPRLAQHLGPLWQTWGLPSFSAPGEHARD